MEIFEGVPENLKRILLVLPLCRQIRFAPMTWRQDLHATYGPRWPRYLLNCLICDIGAVAEHDE